MTIAIKSEKVLFILIPYGHTISRLRLECTWKENVPCT